MFMRHSGTINHPGSLYVYATISMMKALFYDLVMYLKPPSIDIESLKIVCLRFVMYLLLAQS
jgi:hypothetical protein